MHVQYYALPTGCKIVKKDAFKNKPNVTKRLKTHHVVVCPKFDSRHANNSDVQFKKS